MIDPLLHIKLNAEAGQISWKELERHFARGVLIKVAGELDLIAVAACVSSDDRQSVERWLTTGQIARATVEDASIWNEHHTVFWAVVTAPWVLAQEVRHRKTEVA